MNCALARLGLAVALVFVLTIVATRCGEGGM
jgi:hypothetical protein